MTKRVGGMVIIAYQDPEECEMCHAIAECRPYGPDGMNICFACGQLDAEGTKQRMAEYMFPKETKSDYPKL